MLKYNPKNKTIFVVGTGGIICNDVSPKFLNWTYEMYQEDPYIKFLEPMTAKEADINDNGKGKIAEIKFDGHRSLCYVTPQGNRFFSRRISKKTNWYAENTDCLPHLRDYVGLNNYMGTVLDGEIVMPTKGTSKDVQSVTGALPATALQNQIEKGFAVYQVFDILYYKGINIQALPLWIRKLYLHKVLRDNHNPCIKEAKFYATQETIQEFIRLKETHKEGKWWFTPVPEMVESFKKLCEQVWEFGEEGLVIKNLFGKYMQKRHEDYGKLKGIIHKDVVVMGFGEPTEDFEGKTSLDDWDYWIDSSGKTYTNHYDAHNNSKGLTIRPVTKPFAKDWVGSIIGGVWKKGKLVKVVELLGITDEDQIYIKKNKESLIGTCIEVEAHEFIDKTTGSLRHPRFSRWRDDKDGKSCIWEDYINVG